MNDERQDLLEEILFLLEFFGKRVGNESISDKQKRDWWNELDEKVRDYTKGYEIV